MATEIKPSDSATDSTETVDQKADESTETPQVDEDTSQDPNASADGDDKQETPEEDASKKALLADLYKERNDRKALQAQVDKLTADASTLTDSAAQLTTVQRKYDRLEEFLLKSGSPLGKALDSMSFAKRLFDGDEDVAEIVKSWNKDNPSLTQVALGSGNGVTSSSKPSINDLLRKASN